MHVRKSTSLFLCHSSYNRFRWKCYNPEIHKIQKLNSSVQIQIKPKSQFEFASRDIEKSVCLDLVDFRGVAIQVENVMCV